MRKFLTSVAIAAAAVAGAGSANAFVVLTLRDITGGIGVTCDTTQAVSATNCSAAAGFTINNANNVSFDGTVGGFQISTTSGVANAPGNPAFAQLNASSTFVQNVSGVAGQRLFFIDLAGFGFTLPASPIKTVQGSASLTGAQFGPLDTVRSDFYASPLNDAALLNGTNCSMQVLASNNCNGNGGAPLLWGPSSATFSLRDIQTFSLGNGSGVNTTSTVTVRDTPEPVSTSLVGAALVALALTSRRRAAKKA